MAKKKELESQDEGNPTEDVPEGEDTQPDGQTAASSGVLGDSDEDFAPQEVQRPSVDEDDEEEETPKIARQLTKALGLKDKDLLAYNERTRTAVYSNGGKYQISLNGKSLRHLAGPTPPADLKLKVVDARMRGGLTGTAAAINSALNDPSGGV